MTAGEKTWWHEGLRVGHNTLLGRVVAALDEHDPQTATFVRERFDDITREHMAEIVAADPASASV